MNSVIDDRFIRCLDLEEIKLRVSVRPEPVGRLSDVDVMIASQLLKDALSEIYLPNEFSQKFIKEMYHRAYFHHCSVFSSEAEYISKIYNPPETEVVPICLTGLAGVGKSRTIAALRKILPGPVDFTCDHYYGEISLVSHWYQSARGKSSGGALLLGFLTNGESFNASRLTVAKLLVESRRRSIRDCVALLILDEMQHVSTGGASARVTDILLSMAAIGPPMIYVCNYSLVHKLFGRNSEDVQRLLADPRIMLPDDPHSEDWLEYIAECIRVSNGHIQGALDQLSEEIYRCTFGIKRFVVQLLRLAYIECRDDNRQCVAISDLAKAYSSAAYTVSANEVEELQLQALNNRKRSGRVDLYCPFKLPAALSSNVVQFAKTVRQERVSTKVFDSALNAEERAGLKAIEELLDAVPKKQATRRAPVTQLGEDDQAKLFMDFGDSFAPPRKPRGPK